MLGRAFEAIRIQHAIVSTIDASRTPPTHTDSPDEGQFLSFLEARAS